MSFCFTVMAPHAPITHMFPSRDIAEKHHAAIDGKRVMVSPGNAPGVPGLGWSPRYHIMQAGPILEVVMFGGKAIVVTDANRASLLCLSP